MVNDSSARYKKKQRNATKKARERYQNLAEEEKEKHENMVVSDIKIFPKIKQKLVEYRKNF